MNSSSGFPLSVGCEAQHSNDEHFQLLQYSGISIVIELCTYLDVHLFILHYQSIAAQVGWRVQVEHKGPQPHLLVHKVHCIKR